MSTTAKEILEHIKRGTADIISEPEVLQQLSTDKPLRIKLGVDPTAPDIHFGHLVVLDKLKKFQDLGHKVIFLIGDFTATIGDPSGKESIRKPLTREQVLENTKTYEQQVYKVLNPEQTEVAFNSQWMDKLSAKDLIQLAATHTVARMLERDDFNKRYANGQPIAIHEFLYPLLQGYDSVILEADIELGGTDQTFNLLMGRELQRHFNQKPQCVITMPLLEGLDGVKKMSKSLNNYISIIDSPDNMFGKLMSISDQLMWRYYELLSSRSLEEIERLKISVDEGKNPRDIKFLLAEELVTRLHNEEMANQAHENFRERFQQHILPSDLEDIRLEASNQGRGLSIRYILQRAGLVQSTSEALRLIKQGAVRMDGERLENIEQEVPVGDTHIYQVGKRRFAKVTVI
jgi:tyrosyl-tRNA synthetase